MRAIKFRAWDKTDKFMMDNVYFRRVDLSKIPFKRSVEGPRWTVNLECEEIEIMQFIGLLDKNKKEAYQDDIASFPDDLGAGEPMIGRIIWDEDQMAWGVVDEDGYHHLLCELTGDGFEVIGNKWENPDLLQS